MFFSFGNVFKSSTVSRGWLVFLKQNSIAARDTSQNRSQERIRITRPFRIRQNAKTVALTCLMSIFTLCQQLEKNKRKHISIFARILSLRNPIMRAIIAAEEAGSAGDRSKLSLLYCTLLRREQTLDKKARRGGDESCFLRLSGLKMSGNGSAWFGFGFLNTLDPRCALGCFGGRSVAAFSSSSPPLPPAI